MAKQLYGYGAPATTSASRSRTDSYLTDSVLTRYLGTRSDPLSSDSSKYSASSSMYLTQSDSALRYSVDRGIASAAAAATSPHLSSWPPPPGVDAPSAVDSLVPGLKRTPEVLYHPTLLGAHSTIGQSEDWYSTNALAKRARFETTSHLPIYPQRPGEKDCAYYMLTRTCKFGDTCKFDHPVWVPEGGIPDWKEDVPEPHDAYWMIDLKSNEGGDQIAVETDQSPEAASVAGERTTATAITEMDASKQASSSGADAEEVRQVSPASNTSTVVNLAERARQRAMLRQGGSGAPAVLSPPGARGRGRVLRGRVARGARGGRGGRGGRSGRGQTPGQQG